ncbi:MAG TPA: carboxymuconolactone decarboxylase family protein [Ktedonobacteraceae bacterium]|nr:carboxymuconolactone decarboxylase family protein [Ktedonobacteraceae bacterium]
MSDPNPNALANLQRLSEGDPTVLSFVKSVIENSYKESGLDPKTFMLVRLAALAALDAAPASWLMNIEASGEAGLDPETVLGTLVAVLPVIGTARVVSAASNIMKAFAMISSIE